MSEINQKQYIVQFVKRLAQELNKIPSESDFKKAMPRVNPSLLYSSYEGLLIAAGLKNYQKEENYHSELFDLQAHLKKYHDDARPFALTKKAKLRRLHLGDIHFPFANLGAISMVYQMIEEIQPTEIVQLGDLNDCYAHAKFPRSHNVITPYEEAKMAREMGLKLWETIRKLAPKASLYQILGNHDIRPHKRVMESYPEGETFLIFDEYYKFDGVQTHFDIRDPLKLGSTFIHHGHLSKLGAHMELFQGNTVCGHSHRGGVAYKRIGNEIFWELNAGYLGDEKAKPLGYMPTKFNGWTLGCGMEDDFGARFISF
jgi:hypothetical protein